MLKRLREWLIPELANHEEKLRYFAISEDRLFGRLAVLENAGMLNSKPGRLDAEKRIAELEQFKAKFVIPQPAAKKRR